MTNGPAFRVAVLLTVLVHRAVQNRCQSPPSFRARPINTKGFEFGPYVTDDKRYLLYSSSLDFTRVDVYWIRFDRLLESIRAGQDRGTS